MKVVCKTVSVLVFRRQEDALQYLLLRRTPERGGNWEPVCGRIQKGERAEDAARRELCEETGSRAAELRHLDRVHVYFKPGKRRIYLEPCFAVEMHGSEPRLCKEHDGFAWLDGEQARDRLAHTGLREVLDELHGRLVREAPRGAADELLVPATDDT